MTRIHHAGAYAPLTGCYWQDSVAAPDWPVLEGCHRTEVAIIGGGFTGLSAAYHLARDGVGVTVLEAEAPGWGASGRNGGFCCLGGAKASDRALRARFGEDERRAYRRAERAAVDLVDGLLQHLDLEVDRHSEGETLLAHRRRDADGFTDEIAAIEADYGVTPQVLRKEELAQHGLNGPFHGALTVPVGFGLNPRKYLFGLAEAAQAAGAHLHAHSAVTGMTRTGRRKQLRTANGTVTADTVIIATNGYSHEDLPPWMAARTMPMQSSAMVTRPLSRDEMAAQGWISAQMAYDTRNLLHYFRLMPNGRFLFGMRGGLRATPGAEARARAALRRDFDAMFPAWAHVEATHTWSGLVCLTRDLTPYIGPVPDLPGVFAGFAYHGNGVAMGSYAGALLADLVQEKTPDTPYPAPLRTPPARFPLGRLRLWLMQPAFWAFALRDL